MSSTTAGQQGLEAAEKKQWEKAIPLLSKGLEAGTNNPVWLLARSQAYQETGQYDRALADADRAYLGALARQHPKTREHLAQAQYRRAVILGHLKRYADADACCVWSQQLIEGKKNFRKDPDDVSAHVDPQTGEYLATPEEAAASTTSLPQPPGGDASGKPAPPAMGEVKGMAEWARAYTMRTMMLRAMQNLPKGDSGRKITVKRVPDMPKDEDASSGKGKAKEVAEDEDELKDAATAAQAAPPPKPAVKNIRVDFYQTADKVNLVLYAKGVDKDKLKVDISQSKIQLFNLPENVAGSTAVALALGGSIDADVDISKAIKVTPYKIELTFAKKPAGTKWGAWGTQESVGAEESSKGAAVTAADANAAPAPTTTTTATTASAPAPAASAPASSGAKPAGPPAYPTSSRSGPKNWEAVAGDADADEAADAGGEVNGFFRQLYAGSTPEQQRAMVKSFVESNGTTLSTDWDSVSKEKVATQPPEGVEAKKW